MSRRDTPDPTLEVFYRAQAWTRERVHAWVEEDDALAAQLTGQAHILSFPSAPYVQANMAARTLVGLPDPFALLPFPVCYLGLGEPIPILVPDDGTEDGVWFRQQGFTEFAILGLLASREGHILVVTGFGRSVGSWQELVVTFSWHFAASKYEDIKLGWLLYMLLLPLQQHTLVRTTPELGLRGQRARERAVRAGGSRTPRPYYKVTIDGAILRSAIEATVEENRAPMPERWSHRWDVRKHHASRFLRGSGEISVDVAQKLMTRGYEVYFAPDVDVDRELLARGMQPQQPGEWLARKQWEVAEHIRGPESKPYVPALRVVTGAR